MAVIIDKTADTAQTHILIIAVGGYPYLSGGSRHKAQTTRSRFGGLGQLTPPPLSAAAFFEEVMAIDARDGWALPLGSVEVLASSHDEIPVQINGNSCVAATISEITRAFTDWWNRCERNAGNCAIFYFCGHGLEKSEQYLLAEDFMCDGKPNSFGAFNLTETWRAFHACRTGTRVFLIDACRDLTTDMLTTAFRPSALVDEDYVGYIGANSLFQRSTGPRQGAFGETDQISVYTKALIQALRGKVATNDNNLGWVLQTAQLGLKINLVISRQQAFGSPKQTCSSEHQDSFVIVKYDGPPMVDVELSVMPPEWQQDSAMQCYTVLGNKLVNERAPHPDKWQLYVPAGTYKVVITSYKNPSLSGEDAFTVLPPFFERIIRY